MKQLMDYSKDELEQIIIDCVTVLYDKCASRAVCLLYKLTANLKTKYYGQLIKDPNVVEHKVL